MPTIAGMKGVEVLSLDTVTTGTGISVCPVITAEDIKVNVRGVGAIGAGTISIEEATDPNYSGTWSQITSISATGLTGGAEQVVHIAGSCRSLRGRITANITGGGTVSVGVICD